MASSSGSGSGASSELIHLLGSEVAVDRRKEKRMLSNRESARRSRMRKQQHLDDLMAQVAQLRKENNHVLTTLNITNQHYISLEAENSVLRTQMVELSTRLQSMEEILRYMNVSDDGLMRPWDVMLMTQQQQQQQQPIMADMFQY